MNNDINISSYHRHIQDDVDKCNFVEILRKGSNDYTKRS